MTSIPEAGEASGGRLSAIRSALAVSEIDALLCTLPSNILLVSGYWPVVGTSMAIATREGRVILVVPEDEVNLANDGWAADVRGYKPGTVGSLEGPADLIVQPLRDALMSLELTSSVIGIEMGPIYEESTYSASFRLQAAIGSVLRRASGGVKLTAADEILRHLRYTLTAHEVDRIRHCCSLARRAFQAGRKTIAPGEHEFDVAAAVSGTMERTGLASGEAKRVGAFAWCMAGPDSAKAGGAYAMTGSRKLEEGDLVLIHSNPYVDGYFADVTRTYCAGHPTDQIKRMYEAIFKARDAALAMLRPGVVASTVDLAARKVLDRAGFAQYFTHGLGHSVGFSAISADFPPRLHPKSSDVLEQGCTFNVEPAIYIPEVGGIRHCDVVTITWDSFQMLTPFDDSVSACILDF